VLCTKSSKCLFAIVNFTLQAEIMQKATFSYKLRNTAEILKALAHPERLAILDLMGAAPKGRLTVKAIYDELRLQQPIASRHLAILKSIGIVYKIREGQKVLYGLNISRKAVASITTLEVQKGN